MTLDQTVLLSRLAQCDSRLNQLETESMIQLDAAKRSAELLASHSFRLEALENELRSAKGKLAAKFPSGRAFVPSLEWLPASYYPPLSLITYCPDDEAGTGRVVLAPPPFLQGKPRHKDWQRKSEDFKVGKTCANCGGGKYLQVHHVRPYHEAPELEMDESNWLVLCMDPWRLCHFTVGHYWNWLLSNPDVRETAARNLAGLEQARAAAYRGGMNLDDILQPEGV